MKNRSHISISIITIFIVFVIIQFPLLAQQNWNGDPAPTEEIEKKVQELMEQGNIPGLSLVIINGEEPVYIKGFGYADLEKKIPVDANTLFELASVSKAFTGLAVLNCEFEGMINLNDRLTKYYPSFKAFFEGEEQEITLKQLMYQSSGLPTNSISYVQAGDEDDAMQNLVERVSGIKLAHKPGTRFVYATINYSILGAVIEKATGIPFEKYMKDRILDPLDLTNTYPGVPKGNKDMAVGYKKTFFSPERYDSPVFRCNTPAGYVVSNGKDMARWIQLQMGLEDGPLSPLILMSQQGDLSVAPNLGSMSYYGAGWRITFLDTGMVFHSGDNPNFSTHVIFSNKTRRGVVVLANASSPYTVEIGRTVMNAIHGRENAGHFQPPKDVDTTASVTIIIVGFIILLMIAFIGYVILDIIKGRRQFQGFQLKSLLKIASGPIVMAPFLYGIYIIPKVIMDFTWESAFVWTPSTFRYAVYSIVGLVTLGYICFILTTLFPHKNHYIKSLPMLFVLSFVTGGSNAALIFLITIALFTPIAKVYLLYYFGLTLVLTIAGRKVLQTRLIRITLDIVYDLRVKLLEKIFYTSYQKFEKLQDGRIFATLNNDTGQLAGMANMLIALVTSIITTVGVFVYMATIALWATLLTLGIIGVIGTIYFIVSQRTRPFFEAARDTQNVYMGLLNGMVGGFKEISIHYNKRISYKEEVIDSCDLFRDKASTAQIRFVNAFLIGESLLFLVLGTIGFGVPILFPEIAIMTLLSFIMVLLFLIGPINGILRAIPAMVQIRVAWDRITGFIDDVPANLDPKEIEKLNHDVTDVGKIEAKDVYFEYETTPTQEKFIVGPIDFDASKGEIVFVIGGNGSGKTTLAKLLTGLYLPAKGRINIDGKEVNTYQLGEYFSVVFGDFHLFEKLYNVDLTGREKEVKEYLKLLRLDDKVVIENNAFDTLELSNGQRKRLALLQCYLEDRPIFLFDELAADQDPEFRRFFYRELLQRMKEKGKIVIAITHDDHYFDAADRLVKMDMGKFEYVEDHTNLRISG